MRPFQNILAATAAATVVSASAPKVSDSPAGAHAIAKFPEGGNSSVKGSVQFSSESNGQVKVSVDISGLPTGGTPYLYHIHEFAVPEDGNCTATGEHLNTYKAPTPCDASTPDNCELGDLSGKWGTFNSTSYSTSFTDPYLSLDPSDESFIAANRSIVFHFHNKTRIACANLEFTAASSNVSSNNTKNSTSGEATSTYDGAANALTVAGSTGLAGLAVLLSMLL